MGNAAERGMQHIEPKHVTFGDEKTRRRMEIQQQVQYLSVRIPPMPIPEEGYDLTPISFAEELRDDGATALFHIGDFMDTETYGEGKEEIEVKFVQPRTIQILDALGLPYINNATIENPQE